MLPIRAVLTVLILTTAGVSFSQTKRQLPSAATKTAPIIDGDINDPVWGTAAKAEGFLDQASGTPSEDPTTAYILYDDKNIYIAFDCRDTKPAEIVARNTVRDSKFQSRGDQNTEDNVQVDIDPFLSSSGSGTSSFSVNPLGTRSANFAGGRASKAEWNGEWEAAAKRTDTGWTAEMRIPWATLNFPTGREKINIGINFYRYMNRTKRLQEWSRMGVEGFQENQGVWLDVPIPTTVFKPTLSLLPYVLGGLSKRGVSGKAGVDMRYTITPQLTAVGTINPDFSGLEAAVKTIAFSSTEIFLPEFRPFFIEGGQFFDFPWGANSKDVLFYSRRIPSFDIGAKVFGKLNPRDTIGFLNTYDYNGRNDMVARYAHQYSPTGEAGAMIIRKDSREETNQVSLVNNHFRTGKLGLDMMAATSTGRGAGGGMQVGSGYYADKFLTTILHVSAISSNFYAPNSFIPLTNYKGYWYSNFLRYNWKTGPFSGAQVVVNAVEFTRPDGRPYDKEYTGRYTFYTRNDWLFSLDHNDIVFEGLRDRTVGMEITKGHTNRFQTYSLYVSTGETGSVKSTYIAPVVKLRLLGNLDLLYSGGIQNRAGLQQQHVITANYELSPTRSFGGRVVTRNADTNAYFFYRNSDGKGTDYFIILGDPNAQKTVSSLQVKAVFAF